MDKMPGRHGSVLIVAAHPDDEVLGCGGTIAGLAKQGQSIHIAIMGEVITCREQPKPAESVIAEKRSISQQAAKVLGARDVSFHDLPDNRFDTVPLLDVVRIVEGLVTKLKPDTVYTHHGGDLNIDHQIVSRAVLTATRPLPGQTVHAVYAFEIPSSTEWAFQNTAPAFRPNVFMDISGTLDTKLKAFSLYESEIRPFPHPRSPEAIQAMAQRWGSVTGCTAAEAFELLRAFRGGD